MKKPSPCIIMEKEVSSASWFCYFTLKVVSVIGFSNDFIQNIKQQDSVLKPHVFTGVLRLYAVIVRKLGKNKHHSYRGIIVLFHEEAFHPVTTSRDCNIPHAYRVNFPLQAGRATHFTDQANHRVTSRMSLVLIIYP